MRQTAHDFGFVTLSFAVDRLDPFSSAANQVVRQIGQRLQHELIDLVALALGVAKQVRDIGFAVADALDGGQ